jgi:transposase
MVLSRQQRERLVLDLYNQGKNTREIAEEARMSFSAIGAILKKAEKENETSKERTEKMSQAAQAYKLFSEGKSPVDVAITLNLRQADVTELYNEYWNLKNLHELNQVYEEIKGDIHSFVKLYKLAKAVGMNTQHVGKLLAIANNHLPSVEYRYQELKREVNFLEVGKKNSARIFQKSSEELAYLHNVLDSYRSSCEEERKQMGELYQQMTRLEALVDDFQNNSEECIKITRAVEEKVLSVLSNVKVLLRCAILSITESIRNNPERFRSLFYNMLPSIIDCYDSNGQQDYAVSYMYGPDQQQKSSPDYKTDANAAVIVEEAEKLFYKLIKDCVNKTVANLKTTNLACDSKLSSSSPRKELSDVHKDSTQKLAASYT